MPAIIFDVTRTGDLSKAGSVTWTLEGDLRDADLAPGQLTTGSVGWAANETAGKTVTINTVGNTVDNPDRTCRIRLSAPNNGALGTATATTTILDDDATVAQGCTNPRMGPARSSDKLLLFRHHNRSLTGPYAALASVQDKFTKLMSIGQGLWRIPQPYNHSDDGIKAMADANYDQFIKYLAGDPQCKIFWWDWEENNSSLNVSDPATILAQSGWTTPYNKTTDTFHAALYDTNIFPGFGSFKVTQAHAVELRKEAARFGGLLAKYIMARADADGMTDFEQMSYTHPDNIGTGVTWDDVYRDLNPGWMCPYMLGGGQPCYWEEDLAGINANYANPAHWTTGYANKIKAQRAAFGPNFKIIMTVWPRFYRTDLPGVDRGTASLYPNGSFALPTGFMTKFMTDVFAPGVGLSGVTYYMNSSVNNASAADVVKFNQSAQEFADYVTAHKDDFAGIRYA